MSDVRRLTIQTADIVLDVIFVNGSKLYFDPDTGDGGNYRATDDVASYHFLNGYKAGHKFSLVLKTIREVERSLMLCVMDRAGLARHRGRRSSRWTAMRLLHRLATTGHEVMVSHVLSILGGPIERRVRDLQTVPRRRWIVSWQHVDSQRTLTTEE